jgi:hypothetical protein
LENLVSQTAAPLIHPHFPDTPAFWQSFRVCQKLFRLIICAKLPSGKLLTANLAGKSNNYFLLNSKASANPTILPYLYRLKF